MNEQSQEQLGGEWNSARLHYANLQDSFVVAQLSTAPFLRLPVDQFAKLDIGDPEPPSDAEILAFRIVLIRIYAEAAIARFNAKSMKGQRASAAKALAHLTKAIQHLDNVAPPAQRGLRAIFGAPVNDSAGVEESNAFHQLCWQLKLDVVPILKRLWQALEGEQVKPGQVGARRKRLRLLMEKLADWWVSTGKPLAPYVYAKRLAGKRAVVVDRRGPFASLARALFRDIDGFTDKEVIAALTNVHEERLAQRKAALTAT